MRGSHCARASSSTDGTRNASVFPLPVFACASTSCPRISGGIARAWISVSVSKPIAAIAAFVPSSRSSDENGTFRNSSGGASASSADRACAAAAAASSSAASAFRASAAAAAAAAASAASRFFFFSFRRSRRCAGERMGFDDAADDEDASAAVEAPSTPLSFFLGFAASGATDERP